MTSDGQDRSKPKRVVIVGGGLAGLAAAEALTRHGGERMDVTVIESKQSVGGRAGSFTDRSSGATVDYCQHVAMGCCTNLLALFERSGLGERWVRHRSLEFLHPDHPPSRFVASRWLPPPFHLAGAIRGLRFLTRSQQSAIGRAMFRLMRTPSAQLRGVTAGEWLRSAGQDDLLRERFWDVILISALAERTDVVSMSAARKVLIDGFAASRDAADVWVPASPLSDLVGRRLAGAVETLGAKIRRGERVLTVTQSENQRATVRTESGAQLSADQVILAVPWHAIGKLAPQLGAAQLDPLREIPASPITGMHLWFDRPLTSRRLAVLVGTHAQWLFRPPGTDDAHAGIPPSGVRASSERPPEHYLQVVISGGQSDRVRGEALVEMVVGELKHAFPEAAGATLLRHRTVTDPRAVFSVSPEVERSRPPSGTALPWLQLAGDWVATGWPATMEGAVIGGRMAANEVLRKFDFAPVPIDPGLPRGWLARRLIRDGD